MESLTFTTTEFRAAACALEPRADKLTQRMLAYWTKIELVTPSVRRAHRGMSHLWSAADLARVRLVMQLRHGKVTLPHVRAALTYLDKDLRRLLRPDSKATLVVDRERRRAHIVRAGQPDVEVAPKTGQLRLRFDSMFEGIEAAAAKRARAA